MTKLRKRMLSDLQLRGLAATTQKDYILRVAKLGTYFRRPPDQLDATHVRQFLHYLINRRKASPATHHGYVAAFKFFYDVTVERPEVMASIPLPQGSQEIARGPQPPGCRAAVGRHARTEVQGPVHGGLWGGAAGLRGMCPADH